ncbi:putative redox protein [Anseongella ginsenosidimutans]|uniref:Putative redox protein n=1 Tax=Anseongella ginsenosidimutans TaxID=496056 RepID=A0A4R3KRM4_9SPHI|nr:OsmC family protein [Anseongella ginsenosidimutans]QEC53881.1 OsmC family protein [Anseongella ginsenosidimutans]TCS86263.1 putative redox protein [Anseongella ginsenosidimutans]
MRVELQRIDDAFHFEAVGTEGVKVDIDGSRDIGAAGAGARPMELILMGLGGCSAIDVILILKKQRQVIEDLKIVLDGERVDDTPAVFKAIRMDFQFTGELDRDKVKRAIQLSVEKYCSVYAMLAETAEITHSFSINGEK